MGVIEVDEKGNIIEYFTMSEEDIEQEIASGRYIIIKGWQNKRLFNAKYDFEKEDWVEGLSSEEVAAREAEIEEFNNKLSDTEMNAIALMELSSYMLGR